MLEELDPEKEKFETGNHAVTPVTSRFGLGLRLCQHIGLFGHPVA
jgi:hypothetical protein